MSKSDDKPLATFTINKKLMKEIQQLLKKSEEIGNPIRRIGFVIEYEEMVPDEYQQSMVYREDIYYQNEDTQT